MSKVQKILIFISVLLIVVVGGFLCYKFWVPISSFFTKKLYLTEEQGQQLYDEGYKDGNKNEIELQNKINYYIDLVSEVPTLEKEIENKENSIINLKEEIKGLELYKSELISQYDQLSKTHNLCLETQNGLLNQIANLNLSISEKLDLVDNMEVEKILLTSQLSEKNLEIIKLKQDINYYEQFIYTLTDSDKVTVKFIYDDNVHAIQVLNKNSIATINTPTSTNYVKFNYWTIDGITEVDLSTYILSDNTTFIANITKYYDVKFVVDGEIINSQIIENNKTSLFSGDDPTKNGYVFAGWTLDGNNLVDVTSYQVTSNTTFIAKFTRLNVVEFMFDGKTIATQYIEPGEFAENVVPEYDTNKYIFNYWSINGEQVDLSTYTFTDEYTLVVANFTRIINVSFKVDNVVVKTLQLEENSLITEFPNTPTKNGYHFVGWTILGSLVDFDNYIVTEDVIINAQFTDELIVTFKVDDQIFDSTTCKSGNSLSSYSNVPTKVDNEFLGWTIDGSTVINLSTYPINNDITFIAKFKLVRFDVVISSAGSQCLENSINNNIGFYAYRQDVDLSEYSFNSQPFNIGLNLNIGNGTKVVTINELFYNEIYGIHRYSYNYYPDQNNDNIHYDISVEVYSSYVRLSIFFYGSAELRNSVFTATLSMSCVG